MNIITFILWNINGMHYVMSHWIMKVFYLFVFNWSHTNVNTSSFNEIKCINSETLSTTWRIPWPEWTNGWKEEIHDPTDKQAGF